VSVTPGRRPSAQSPLGLPTYMYTLSPSSEPFSLSSVFSLVIPVFLLSRSVSLLPSDTQPKLTGCVHIPLCSLSAATAAIKAALMATSPCLTSASHSGWLMDTLLLLYFYLCPSVVSLSLSVFHPLPSLVLSFQSATHCVRCYSLHNEMKDRTVSCVYVYT